MLFHARKTYLPTIFPDDLRYEDEKTSLCLPGGRVYVSTEGFQEVFNGDKDKAFACFEKMRSNIPVSPDQFEYIIAHVWGSKATGNRVVDYFLFGNPKEESLYNAIYSGFYFNEDLETIQMGGSTKEGLMIAARECQLRESCKDLAEFLSKEGPAF